LPAWRVQDLDTPEDWKSAERIATLIDQVDDTPVVSHGNGESNVQINDKKIGKNHPCFITFEIGATHNGFESAKNLIKIAAESGADAVKFQILDSNKLIADKEQKLSYPVLINRATGEIKIREEPIFKILQRRELSQKEWMELKIYADSLGLAFFATVCFVEEIEFAQKMGCQTLKIASGDINHFPLIKAAAQTGLSIQLDTGMSTINGVKRAVKIIENEGNNNIIIHHCSFGYPAEAVNINLGIIGRLKEIFNYPIAYSDHSIGTEMDIAALGMGVDMIEKTITEDRTASSVEHVISLEPNEAKLFVQTVRNIEMAMESTELSTEDKVKRDSGRRSIFLKKDSLEGHVITEEDLTYRRPGDGIPPDQLESVLGKKLRANKCSEEKLSLKDLID